MVSKFDKALSGFNTNLKYGGKIYHVQTEDSGKARPHVITHVFVDGNIIATKKESYEEYLGREDVDAVVKEIMKKQHKEMTEKVTAGLLQFGREFSVDVAVEAESNIPLPAAGKAEEGITVDAQKPRRPSGFYKKIYRREPTPIPFMPSVARNRMRASQVKESSKKREKKVFMAGQEVPSTEKKEKVQDKEKQDKTLEEIIADYLSEKLISE